MDKAQRRQQGMRSNCNSQAAQAETINRTSCNQKTRSIMTLNRSYAIFRRSEQCNLGTCLSCLSYRLAKLAGNSASAVVGALPAAAITFLTAAPVARMSSSVKVG